jgi:tetratricopeptide (TPR) repeat protein
MENLNLPTSVDWFNATVVSIVGAVITGVITQLAGKKIDGNRAFNFIVGSILCALVLTWFWYNIIGSICFSSAQSIENSQGCAAAVSTYERAILWNPKITEARESFIHCAISLNRTDTILPVLEPLEKTLADNWHYWYELVGVYLRLGNLDKMFVAINHSADLYPKNTDWITSLGEMFHRPDQYAVAEAVLRIVRNHNNADSRAVFWLSWALYEQKKYDDALFHFGKCIEMYSGSVTHELIRCHAGKGLALYYTGKTQEAKTELAIAIALDPNQEDVRQIIGQLP